MKFKQIIKNQTWQIISSKFLEIYPDAEEDLDGYKSVFEKLLVMTPEEFDMSIVITHEKDEDQEYFDVSGLHNHPKNEEENYSQGIEFMPWPQWLGMDINKETLEDFSEQEIIVHCLYEMCFVGFSEEEIQKVIRRSEIRTKKREERTEDEQEELNNSMEALLKQWRDEEGEN